MRWFINAKTNCVRDEMTYACKKKLCKQMRWLVHAKKHCVRNEMIYECKDKLCKRWDYL